MECWDEKQVPHTIIVSISRVFFVVGTGAVPYRELELTVSLRESFE
jgi:hypothetical protein